MKQYQCTANDLQRNRRGEVRLPEGGKIATYQNECCWRENPMTEFQTAAVKGNVHLDMYMSRFFMNIEQTLL